MDAIVTLVETISSTCASLATILFTILNVNYVFLDTLLGIIWEIISKTVYGLSLILSGIIYAVDDFKQFVGELVGGIETLAIIIHNAGKFAGKFIVSLVSFLSLSSYTGVYSVLKSVADGVYFIINGLKSFLVLTLQSILLILESIPWAVTTVCNGTFQWSSFLLESFVIQCNKTTADTITFCKRIAFNVKYTIVNIPRDAYIGLVTILFVYFIHRYMRRTIIRAVKCSFRFLKTALRRTVQGYHSVCGFMLRCKQNINSFCLLLLQHLPSLNSDDLPDNDDNQEESDQASEEDSNEEEESGSDEQITGAVIRLKRELASQKDAQACIVCLSNPKDTIFLPCRHMCACQDCCHHLVYRRAPCPLCRKFIRNTIRVYT